MNNDLGLTLQKEDYILAASCGLIAGLIDIIFVGDPTNSKLGKVVDDLADNYVIKAAQFFYDMDKRKPGKGGKQKKRPEGLHDCISYLEQSFLVRYDARYAKDLKTAEGVLDEMSSSNHHLMSLAHSTDPIGLVFSIIDQFHPSHKASFVDDGVIIRCVPNKNRGNGTPYLLGRNQTSKIFCGFVNWIGHLTSDLVGSSSTRAKGKTGRGMGIPMPFYELSQMINCVGLDGNTFADTMTKVYEEGYDFRFGVTTAIPVVIEELLVRCVWTFRQKFYYKKTWKDSLPSAKNADFRFVLLLSTTTFNIVDGAAAFFSGIEFKGKPKPEYNLVSFFMNVNYVGIFRLTQLLFKECIIRLKPVLKEKSEELSLSVFGENPDKNERNYLALCESVKSYMNCLDYQKTIKDSIKEYEETKEKRIEIEEQARKLIDTVNEQREVMFSYMEGYFADYLCVVDEAIGQMDEGIIQNDSDLFIEGNNNIQTQFGKETQFHNQKEFDQLMDDEEDLIF